MNEAVTSMTKCCFWCLKPLDPDKKLQEGEKMYFESYDPCERCEELFSHGIQVIGVSTSMVMPGMIAVLKDGEGKPLYPTGSMFLATEEWTRELLKDEPEKLNRACQLPPALRLHFRFAGRCRTASRGRAPPAPGSYTSWQSRQDPQP